MCRCNKIKFFPLMAKSALYPLYFRSSRLKKSFVRGLAKKKKFEICDVN